MKPLNLIRQTTLLLKPMITKNYDGFKLWFDRLLSKSLWKQLLVLGVVLVIALGLSYLMLSWSGAEWRTFCEKKDLSMWLLPLYLLIDSNALNTLYIEGHVHGWMLFASSVTFLTGAFVFNGIIIGIITNTIEQRVENHNKGHLHYLNSGHYVILGYDDMVPSVIMHIFAKDPKAYVLLMGAMDADVIREKLRKRFDEKTMKHIIINYGHRTSTEYYKDIHLETAVEVFVVGNRTKPTHDAINVECADCICNYLEHQQQRPARITCVFEDIDTYSAFKTSEIFGKVSQLGIEFIPYNYFMGWAKQVFVKCFYRDFDNSGREFRYPSVFGKKGIRPDDPQAVHLVFVGMTNFSVAFATEAAHVLHFPNAHLAKTKISFVDIHADRKRDEFITRNRHFFEVQSYSYYDLTKDADDKKEPQGRRTEYLAFTGKDADFLDVEYEFVKGDVFSKKVQDLLSHWASEHNEKQYLSVFLALSEQHENFVMGMNMPDAIYDNEVPVFIRQDRSDNFVTNLRQADERKEGEKMPYFTVNNNHLEETGRQARYANIYPFGMNETAFSADDHSMRRAKLLNYLYATADYKTCKFQDFQTLEAIPDATIWADAEKYWRSQALTVALKWSSLYNSYTIRTKLRTLRAMRGLDLEDDSRDFEALTDYEVRQLGIVEHHRWNVEKLLMGYRKPRACEDKYAHPKYADQLKKNKALFIHHDIRPFDELDVIAELDREFSRYIPWIMRMTEVT